MGDTVFTAVIVASFVVFVLIGLVMSRAVKNKADYFVSGRSAGVLLIVGTLVASYLSTVSMMGEAGLAYLGFPFATLLLAAISNVGYIVGVLVFGRYLRESKALTIPEYFGIRFNSPRLQTLAGLMVVIGIGLYLVSVTKGVSIVLTAVTGIDPTWSVVVTWMAFSAFTFLSGSKGVIVTDTVMFFIFVIGGVIGALAIFFSAGGLSGIAAAADASESFSQGLTWHGAVGPDAYFPTAFDTFMYIVTFGVAWFFVISVSPWQASRYMMAKTSQVAVRAGVLAVFVVPFFMVFTLLGAFVVQLHHDSIDPAENVLIWAAQNVMPLGIGAILVGGIFAAGLSSASTFLSLVGFSVVEDMPSLRRNRGLVDAQSSGEGSVIGSRWAMVVVGVVALVLTLVANPTVLEIGYMAASLFAASWGLVAFGSTLRVRMTERAAFYGMLGGGMTVLLLEGLKMFASVQLPVLVNPILVGLLVSLVGILVGNATSRPDPRDVAFIEDLRHQVKHGSTVTEKMTTRKFVVVTALLLALLYGGFAAAYAVVMY